jgi:hypothetical protein
VKQIKIETQIKNQMEAFITSNGIKDTDTTIDNNRFFLVAPNRFGPGYIRLITSTTVWSANLNSKDPHKVGTPKSRVAM